MNNAAMTYETPAEAIAHEIALHFPDAGWSQAMAAGVAAVRRIEARGYEYAVREDWAFTDGHEVVMPVGTSIDLARCIADVLAASKRARHTVIRRIVGTESWHEWGDENERTTPSPLSGGSKPGGES